MPGAVELLARLTDNGVPWAIATSGAERYARLALDLLGLGPDTPLVTRDQVRYAKPDPDLFLTAAQRIAVDIRDSIVVGDSVWDLLAARRAGALGDRPAIRRLRPRGADLRRRFPGLRGSGDLLAHLDEVGVRHPL